MLGGVVFIFRNKHLQESSIPSITTPISNNTFKSKISKPKLVQAIVDWCIQHIGDKQNQPNVQISYHPHRKKYGCYLIDKKLIRIYIKNHKSVETLALTIIHEFVHYIEIKTDKESKNYARLQQAMGYETNPYERSANLIATQYYQQCLMDLSAKGYLSSELPLS
jgi:Zn-dependent peptidase ImmA (M78 family)